MTAVAIDGNGNTSEFSRCRAITPVTAPSITIRDSGVLEGNAGTSVVAFSIFMNAAAPSGATVQYSTADGRAPYGATAADGDYIPAAGTVTFAPGESTKTISVTVSGDMKTEASEGFFVNLSGATNASITDGQATGTIHADDDLPIISVLDNVEIEGDSPKLLQSIIVLDRTPTFPVHFSVTEVSDSDLYRGSSGGDIRPGEVLNSVGTGIETNTAEQPDDAVRVTLYNVSGAVIGRGQGIGTIVDDDHVPAGPPVVAMRDYAYAHEGDAGTQAMTITAELTHATASTVTVPFTTAGYQAVAGADFVAQNGSFVFAPGTKTATATIQIASDTIGESHELFFINLLSAQNATLGEPRGYAIIINDDVTGDVVLTKSAPATVGAGTDFAYTISVTNQSAWEARRPELVDTLPAGVAFRSVTTTHGSCSGTSVIRCDLNIIGVGDTAVVTINVTAPETLGMTANTATVSLPEGDFDIADNQDTVEVQVVTNVPMLPESLLATLAAMLLGVAIVRLRQG